MTGSPFQDVIITSHCPQKQIRCVWLLDNVPFNIQIREVYNFFLLSCGIKLVKTDNQTVFTIFNSFMSRLKVLW